MQLFVKRNEEQGGAERQFDFFCQYAAHYDEIYRYCLSDGLRKRHFFIELVFFLLFIAKLKGSKIYLHTFQYRNLLICCITKNLIEIFLSKQVYVHFGERNYAPRHLKIRRKKSIKYHAYRYLLKQCKIISCNSLDAVRVYTLFFKISSERLFYFPNILNPDGSLVKKSENNTSSFSYVGRLITRKKILEIIKYFSEHKHLELHIAGDGPLRDTVSALAKKSKNISYYGHTSVKNVHEKTTSMIFMSDHEGCPNAVLEALASGSRVFVNKFRGGYRELRQHNLTNLYFINDLAEISTSNSLDKETASKIKCFYSSHNYTKNVQHIINRLYEL